MEIGRDVFIGTSNVVVPGNKTSFPARFQSGSRLQYYGSLFRSVEINSSFYKTPLQKTFARWVDDVPDDFRFSVKLHQDFTHTKGLTNDLDGLNDFLAAANGINGKRGALLVQFPGKISIEYYNQVGRLLEGLQPARELGWSVVVEFRNPDWYIRETAELLDAAGASLVLHDMPKSRSDQLITHASSVYLRFHGPKGDYRGSYSDDFLAAKASQINEWTKEGRVVYAYFNNTIGDAFANARTLQAFCGDV